MNFRPIKSGRLDTVRTFSGRRKRLASQVASSSRSGTGQRVIVTPKLNSEWSCWGSTQGRTPSGSVKRKTRQPEPHDNIPTNKGPAGSFIHSVQPRW